MKTIEIRRFMQNAYPSSAWLWHYLVCYPFFLASSKEQTTASWTMLLGQSLYVSFQWSSRVFGWICFLLLTIMQRSFSKKVDNLIKKTCQAEIIFQTVAILKLIYLKTQQHQEDHWMTNLILDNAECKCLVSSNPIQRIFLDSTETLLDFRQSIKCKTRKNWN